MTTLQERKAVSLLISSEDSREAASRIADFVTAFGRLPRLGECPMFYTYSLNTRQELLDMLEKQFIVECEPGKPLRVLYFAHP